MAQCPPVSDLHMTDVTISRMLSDFGVTHPEAVRSAVEALVEAGVLSSRPNRTRIAADKRERVAAVIAGAFLRHCNNGNCLQQTTELAGSRTPLLSDQKRCDICGGSSNRSALERMAAALSERGLSRVLVVGGTEETEREIRGSPHGSVDFRFVNTRVARDDRYHRSHRDWAEVVVIWSSTPLPHKVSRHYEHSSGAIRVTVTRRGVAAMADGVREHVERQRPSTPASTGR